MTGGKRPWRFGIVGCGRVGRWHAEKLHADGRGRVVALCDVPQNRRAADALRDELAPEASVFDDLDALLAASEVDAVVICTPTTLHVPQVRACRERGLHVLC